MHSCKKVLAEVLADKKEDDKTLCPQRDSNSCSRLEKIVASEILLISAENTRLLTQKTYQVLAEVLAVTFHKKPTR